MCTSMAALMSDIVPYTEGEAAEVAICKRVADVLQRHYPGHLWLVGLSDVKTGMVAIDLPEQFKPPSLRMFGYLLHPRNYDNDHAIMLAGGEWLERLALARQAAEKWAQDVGIGRLDVSNAVGKSRA